MGSFTRSYVFRRGRVGFFVAPVDVVVVASVVVGVVVVDVETAMAASDWKTSSTDDVDATSAASASRGDDAGSVEVGSRDMSVVATR